MYYLRKWNASIMCYDDHLHAISRHLYPSKKSLSSLGAQVPLVWQDPLEVVRAHARSAPNYLQTCGTSLSYLAYDRPLCNLGVPCHGI